MKLGVFGGTFDPPHLGHLIVAQDACVALGLDRVLFVPARLPPHKRARDVAPAPLRLEMVRAAVAGDDRFDVGDLEVRRSGPSYTVDTLRELKQGAAGRETELFFMMGVDQFRVFDTWRDPDEIAALATLVVLSRGGAEEVATAADVDYETLAVTRIDVSSTDVRRRVRRGRPIRYLVPDPVEELIRREGLYAEPVASAGGSA